MVDRPAEPRSEQPAPQEQHLGARHRTLETSALGPRLWERGARPPSTGCLQSSFAGSPRHAQPRSPPTEPWSPAGQAGVCVPAGRGGGRAGQWAVGGGIGWVAVACPNSKGGRLRLAGLRRDLLQSGQSPDGMQHQQVPPLLQADHHHPQVWWQGDMLLWAGRTPHGPPGWLGTGWGPGQPVQAQEFQGLGPGCLGQVLLKSPPGLPRSGSPGFR